MDMHGEPHFLDKFLPPREENPLCLLNRSLGGRHSQFGCYGEIKNF